MAEKRSGTWMRSVANMFWTQCGMPVFIYGMFKDTNRKLRATVCVFPCQCLFFSTNTMPANSYDTTELWADSKPDTPQFRNIKGWDLQFRKNAWAFFQAVLDPAQATQDTLNIVNATRKQGTVTFVFETYDDGTPILTDKENGKIASTTRRQHILREYLRIHYCTYMRTVQFCN